MNAVSVLDCTLRDGGRIIDCKFDNNVISGIDRQLCRAGIDIIEVGFLRNIEKYRGDSTFFSSPKDADKYIGQYCKNDTKYVLFVDFDMYNISQLINASETKISGIRYGFTRKNFLESSKSLIREMLYIKRLGYDLYVQDVNTNGYSPSELLAVIEMVNGVSPVSFGIVDTYGAMYLDDLEYIWNVVDHNLSKDIAVDFHSHNNLEMSFALSQRLITLAQNKRCLILDATLHGMAKCAGNLKTELILDFLTRKWNYDYDVDAVLDAIDQYIYNYQKRNTWGYSVPSVIAGIFRSHPNNIIYLTEKYRLNNRDIKYIISEISEEKRQRYDYDNISEIYRKYCATKINDDFTIMELKKKFQGGNILLLASGSSIKIYEEKIKTYIDETNPIVVSVNFVAEDFFSNYVFFANTIHWQKATERISHEKCILTSNIHISPTDVYVVDYSRLIVEDSPLGDNSTIMLLNLLKELSVKKITIAGFDGLQEGAENYIKDAAPRLSDNVDYERINNEIKKIYKTFLKRVNGKIDISFLTPSAYA